MGVAKGSLDFERRIAAPAGQVCSDSLYIGR